MTPAICRKVRPVEFAGLAWAGLRCAEMGWDGFSGVRLAKILVFMDGVRSFHLLPVVTGRKNDDVRRR